MNLFFSIFRFQWCLGLCALGLVGCVAQINLPSNELKVLVQKPLALALQDSTGNTLGFATAFKPGVLIAPDHLWQVDEALYYENQAIEVLARDFRHDVLFFKIPNRAITQQTIWSEVPPGVGQTLDWETENGTLSAAVFSAKADFKLGNVEVEDLMQLSVTATAGDSGKPLFDPVTAETYGMLVAGDSLSGVSYFVRSDVILTLAEEYLD